MQFRDTKGEDRISPAKSPILEPLKVYRDQIVVLSGLKANWNDIHACVSGSFLTGIMRGGRTEVESTIVTSPSSDSRQTVREGDPRRLLELSAWTARRNAGARTGTRTCAYTHTISVEERQAGCRLPMECNPAIDFSRMLFGDSGSTTAVRARPGLHQHRST